MKRVEVFREYTGSRNRNCTVCKKSLANGRVVVHTVSSSRGDGAEHSPHVDTQHPLHADCIKPRIVRCEKLLHCQLCDRVVDFNSLNSLFPQIKEDTNHVRAAPSTPPNS